MLTPRLAGALLLVGVGMCLARPMTAQEFRVETEVFVEQETMPIGESLTLFTSDVVYDFVLAPRQETTVFDIRRGKLMLLDNATQRKTTLTTEQLAEFSATIKTRGTQQGLLGLFEPKFESQFDEAQQRLTLSSERLTYQVTGVPSKHADGAQRFRQFADWYARLNAIRPGNVPPFGRLELNQALAERGLLPVEIERTIVLDRPISKKTTHAKSKHALYWMLSNTDRGRIDQAGRDLVNFTEVSPAVYWNETATASATKP